MPFTEHTRDAIYHCMLSRLIRAAGSQRAIGSPLDIHPFYARFLPGSAETNVFERSFAARSARWFLPVAELVADQFHARVITRHAFHGRIGISTAPHIEVILNQLETGLDSTADRARELNEVQITMMTPGRTDLDLVADLYVRTHDKQKWYFTMKTTRPSKAQCMQMKRFILQTKAIRQRCGQAFASMAYNPKGDGKDLKDGKITQFLEVGTDMLVGRAFWEKIGDATTYDELLQIAAEVGEAARSRI